MDNEKAGKAAQNAEPHQNVTPGYDAIEMEAIVGRDIGTEDAGFLAFRLTSQAQEASDTGKVYTASILDRAIWWQSQTPARAMAHMLHGVAMLARDGALDPNAPARKGVPPIQHVLNILSDRMAWHIDRRRDSCDHLAGREISGPTHPPAESPELRDETIAYQGRCNEVIAALGTAISALARIKDL